MMRTIYCISGLGADERTFSRLQIGGYQLKHIPWLKPLPQETLQAYAGRMRKDITEPGPILMGLSFGGILCTEIARQVAVEKVILISSIRCSKELPLWMRAVAFLSLHKIVPLRSTRLTAPFQNLFLGVHTAEDKRLAEHYRKNVDLQYTKWAVDKIVNWKSDWQHPCTYHIHGDKDRMFPVKRTKPDHILKGGGHFMILDKAGEVSRCINAVLQRGTVPGVN